MTHPSCVTLPKYNFSPSAVTPASTAPGGTSPFVENCHENMAGTSTWKTEKIYMITYEISAICFDIFFYFISLGNIQLFRFTSLEMEISYRHFNTLNINPFLPTLTSSFLSYYFIFQTKNISLRCLSAFIVNRLLRNVVMIT